MCSVSSSRKALSALQPSSLCGAGIIQLFILNLECVRDVPASGAFFFSSLLLFLLSAMQAWSDAVMFFALSDAAKPIPTDQWQLVITPTDLIDYFLASVATGCLLVSFHSGRLYPDSASRRKKVGVNAHQSPAELSRGARAEEPQSSQGDKQPLGMNEKPAADRRNHSSLNATFAKKSLVDQVSGIADSAAGQHQSDEETNTPICPEKYASFPSRLTFFWFSGLVVRGFRKSLSMSDIWRLEKKYTTVYLDKKFLAYVERYMGLHLFATQDQPITTKLFSYYNLETIPNAESPPTALVKGRRSSENQLASVLGSKITHSSTSTLDSTGHLNDRGSAVCSCARCNTNRRNTCADFPGLRPDRVGGAEVNGDLIVHGTSSCASRPKGCRALSHDNVETGKPTFSRVRSGNSPSVQFFGTSRNAGRTADKTADAESILRTDHHNPTGCITSNRASSFPTAHLTNSGANSFSDNASHPASVAVGEKRMKTPFNCGLIMALFATFWPPLLISAFFKLCHDLLLFCGPLLLKRLIGFLENEDGEPLWHGYLYACSMFLVAMVQSFVLHQYFRRQGIIGMNIRTVLVSAVYRKSLKLSSEARCQSTVGEITNLMSTDAQRFNFLMQYINMIWSAPLQVSIALILLWNELGPSILAGLAVLVVMIPANAYIAKISKSIQEKQLKQSDARIKLINELLNGIRVLKLYAWEPSFIREVGAVRDRELAYLRKYAYLDCCISFVFNCAPILVALCTFATYIYSSTENVLNAEKAFVSLSLFNILRFPLFMFPTLLSNLVQAYVSIRRLTNFLLSSELALFAVTHEDTPGVAAVIEHGTFSWDSDSEPSIQNMTIYFPEGQSTAIVGRVGSGKSSLLNSLLGNMERISGRVNVKGSTAYVAQQAWIFNGTLRDNILFHKPFDAERYERILSACALQQDLAILPSGDLTVIGDKGINLSGGQKQRISIARACYSDAEVYLFDDPLAAVDAEVAGHLLREVLGRQGLLAKKTRIIATHNPKLIQYADRVAMIEAGRLMEYGTYSKLTQSRNSRLNVFLISRETEEAEEGLGVATPNAPVALVSNLSRNPSNMNHPPPQCSRSVSKSSTDWPCYSRSRCSSACLPADLAELSVAENEASAAEAATEEGPLDPDHQDFCKSLPHQDDDHGPTKISCSNLPVPHHSSAPPTVKDGDTTETPIPQEKAPDQPETKIATIERNEETMATGRVKLAVFWAYIRRIGSFLCSAGLLSMIGAQLASCGTGLWLADWSSDAKTCCNMTAPLANQITEGSQRAWRLLIYGLLAFLQVSFSLIGYLALAVGNIRAVRSLHAALLNCILRVPTSFFDTVPQGRVINRFSSDVAALDNQLMNSLRSAIQTALQCLVTLVLTASLSPWIIIPLIFLSIFYIAMQNVFVATSRQLKRIDSVSKSPIFSQFSETLLGVETIRAYGLCAMFVNVNAQRLDANNRAVYASGIANRWLAILLETVGNVLTGLVALASVATKGRLSAGFAGLVVSYALNLTQTLNWLVRMTAELESNIVCIERIKEYSELPLEAPWEVEEKPAADWPQGGIEFVNYGTRYRPELDLVLRSITCSIRPGEKIGIVGRTGSGKSSMVLGLFRVLEPANGQIFIDGVDISGLGLHDLRGRITLIPQDPVLFSGTLRFNLDPFNSYDDATVWEALQLANLKSFVEEFASDVGLDMPVSEGGGNLSQGQRQLICLARALLRRSHILILDDATAAVDPQTDQLIQTTVRREFASSTVLTIAHRLNTIMDYDRVMVLQNGCLVEMGPPQELMARPASIFRGLAQEANLLPQEGQQSSAQQ
ncbi:hypothetical protein AAHC03_026665 [Spirometra sp. Aus1]